MSRFTWLQSNWSVWSDDMQEGLGLLNADTGERIEIPVEVIVDLLPHTVQVVSEKGRETPELFHGASTQGTDL